MGVLMVLVVGIHLVPQHFILCFRVALDVTTIGYTLYGCDSFDQDLSNWVVTGITEASTFMQTANGLSTTNYDLTLSGWAQQSGDLQSGVSIDFGNSQYSIATGEQYKEILSGAGWTIVDGGSV
jgi:hypothetical protein